MSSDADLKKYFNPKATTSTSRIDHNRAKDEDNHKYKDDPKSVTNFISKQLLELSLNDRNAILEETHGVRCLAPEETPNFISVALEKLAAEIDKLPIHQKSAYLQSQQHQSGNSETTQTTSTSTSTSTSTYVNTVDFRLRFLRVKLFDAQQAAKHLVKYLEVALEYFGTYALFRPVKLSDFTKEELRVFRTGVAQFLPFRDRHGRRVIVTFMSERVEEISQKLRMKILLYMTYTMGTGDPEQQRKGVVAILWWQDEAKYQFKVTPEHARVQTREFAPIRISALHICTPDTPFFGFVRSMFAMTFHRKVMSRIRFHAGM